VALVAAPLAHADYSNTVVSQGPAGYWRLNETVQPSPTGGTAANSGSLGASANGTYNNFPTKGLPGPFPGSSAVGVDGSSQTITTPWQAGINTTNFSVELWAKPANVPPAANPAYVATSVQTASPRSGWYLVQDNGSVFGAGNAFVMRFFNQNGTSQSYQLAVTNSKPAGSWYHLVVTCDGTNAAMYSDGVAVTNGTLVANPTTGLPFVPNVNAQFSVGIRSDGGFPWAGQVSEVAMYSTTLSAGQVAAHYAAATSSSAYVAAVNADSPALFWQLNDPLDPPAANSGTLGSAANGLYISDAQAGTAGPVAPPYAGFEAGNNSVSFNGGGGVVRIPPINLNTNTVSISCWVKATGAQPLGTGLVVGGSGANASGLTIDPIFGGLGLGYIWNGNNYGVSPTADLGLPALPDSQWAFAALVITPSAANLYICDANNYANWASVANTFNVNHLNQAFSSATLIGKTAGTSANFTGSIDEVTIFNRALSAGELYNQYAAAVGGVPPRIFADLQGPTDAVAAGDPIVLNVDAGGTPPVVYTWSKTGTGTIATTTNSGVLTIASASLADTGTYGVTISNGSGSIPSQQVVVTVVTPSQPIITGVQGFNDRTLYSTGTLSMAVSASGGGLKYQWYKNATPIPQATSSSYTVARVTTANAGNYSVSITNAIGSASNGPVAITIPTVTTNSYEASIINSGPEAWWRLDEASGTNMVDGMGRHDGTYTNAAGGGTLPTLGAAGALVNNPNTAASFSSAGLGIGLVPFSPELNTAQFTIEAWVKTTTTDGQSPVSSSYGSGGWWMQSASGWWLGDCSLGTFGNNNNANTQAAIIPSQWSHIVIEYDANRQSGGTFYPFTLYVNGQTDGFIWGAPAANSGGPFIIGGRGVSATVLADRFFDGQVDEVAVYKRLLPAAELQAHYAARGTVVVPPSFTSALLSQTVTAGKSITFATTVLGTSPISLQWYKDGAPITGATNSSYNIASVGTGNSGTYTLWATNSAATVSTSASLTVINPVNQANVTNNLVLHLKFENDTADSSGRGNNATAVNSPTFVTGKVGSGAFHFNTDTTNTIYNYATLGATAPTDLKFSSNVNFSVAYWVRLPSGAAPGDLPILCSAANSYGGAGITFAPSYQRGGWSWSLNTTGLYGPDNSINDGNWHSLIHTFDRTSTGLTYLDGVLVNSTGISSVGDVDQAGAMNIGQGSTGTYAESGAMDVDDLGVWRRVLTPLEVAQIASAGAAGNSFDTVAPGSDITVTPSPADGNLILNYTSGTLVQSSNLGPSAVWVPVPGATSPYTVTPTNGAYYYRVLLQ